MNDGPRILLLRAADGHGGGSAALRVPGALVETASGVDQALDLLAKKATDAVVAVFPLPGWSPEEALEAIRRRAAVPCVICDPAMDVASAFRLARLGAYRCFDGGDPAAVLETVVHDLAADAAASANARDRASRERTEPWRRFLVGDSRAMQRVSELIGLVGPRRSTVLITGETGTGKEMAARAIHLASPRASRPMVAVNCSALPENLLEAELFGHTKGAFTGAAHHRTGRVEQAHGSTLFLDEISEMPLDLQSKLLRVLQEREFQRLGSSETVRVDVRFIAASNADLLELVREGKFREDLYYRLNVVPLPMPPLRERLGDIPALARHLVAKVCELERIPLRAITPESLDRLMRHDWPGNVRQLENAVEMAVALSGDRIELYPSDFPLPAPARASQPSAGANPELTVPEQGLDYEGVVTRLELSLLEQALARTNGNKKLAAELLGLKRTTLTAKLKSLSVRAPAL